LGLLNGVFSYAQIMGAWLHGETKFCMVAPNIFRIMKAVLSVCTRMFYRAWFQDSAAKVMRSVLFWDVTHHTVVILYQLFRTTYRSHLSHTASTLLAGIVLT